METALLRSAGVMTLHRLTAGDGYPYLTGQVAVSVATERSHVGLGYYYLASASTYSPSGPCPP